MYGIMIAKIPKMMVRMPIHFMLPAAFLISVPTSFMTPPPLVRFAVANFPRYYFKSGAWAKEPLQEPWYPQRAIGEFRIARA
jgi:hypothetical protein